MAGVSKGNESYIVLPSHLYSYPGPPPLVLADWITDCEATQETLQVCNTADNEDDVPLLKIIERLKIEKLSPPERKKRKRRRKTGKRDAVVITRRRGRPKKTVDSFDNNPELISVKYKENFDTSNIKDEYLSDSISDLWNNDESQQVTDTIPEEPSFKHELESLVEHDYAVKTPVPVIIKRRRRKNQKSPKKRKVVKKRPKESDALEGLLNDEKKLVYPCSDCGKTFSAKITLKNHSRIHSGDLYKCGQCDLGFITNYLLKCHQRIHSGDLLMCHTCGKGFTTHELLKVHQRIHSGEKPFTCTVCWKGFYSSSNLQQHKEVHEDSKKYLCSECGTSFSQKRCLESHMFTHRARPYICTTCGKSWARKSDLVEHMRVHTGSKPFECSLCQIRFTQASSLRRHKAMTHNDVILTPFECQICKKRFRSEPYFKKHCAKHEDAESNTKDHSVVYTATVQGTAPGPEIINNTVTMYTKTIEVILPDIEGDPLQVLLGSSHH